MSLSNGGVAHVRSHNVASPYLMLVTIDTGAGGLVRFVNNNVNVPSRGNTFVALPVSLSISSDDGESVRSADLTLDNVTLELIDWVRSLTEEVPVIIEMVFGDSPDTVESSISNLVIKEATYDDFSITATLSADDDLNQKVPSDTYNALQWQGLHDG